MAKYHVRTEWSGGMSFDSHVGNHVLRLDTVPPDGSDSGPSPKRILLSSLAACTGMDVVSLLEKMRASVDDFEMEIEADLTEEHPKVFSEIRIIYRFFGKNFKKAKIEKAIAMSQETYCGVSEMLRKNSPLLYSIEYVNSDDSEE